MSVPPNSNEQAAEQPSPSEEPRSGLPVPLAWEPIDAASEPEGPTLDLFALRAERDQPVSGNTGGARSWDWRRIAAAASLATVVTIGVAAAAMHVGEMRVASSDRVAEHALAARLDAMSTRIESLNADRSHDEIANLRKVLAEIKGSVASTHNVGDGVAQLAARVDRLEKEQGGKLDKLGDRIDHDAASRLADVTARLDKLEAKAAAAGARDVSGPVAQLSERLDRLEKDQAARFDKLDKATTSVAAATPAKPPVATSKFAPAVSNETTGSIDKPRAPLRGYALAEVHNGYAMIASPVGMIEVGPGDALPGGNRVLRIERHGGEWAVITTQGQIVAMDY